ncbi:hypothetical protein K493DRAFT_339707 [Basidiobolus meristosporus CBS 931.73]|uniref:STAS domain-containing protein n=1 Tax=Basidiobolus meristosporus CBS 931.73 TaxID=1314790 RepID=A0A1Y1XYS3_9FUNG|nr:hypothetical protein K493DRAFT_339707 [Basidiobolus meristosporus CBS 931.73]|eukprot:ORX90891.1 hypothetical protein K493DRAFT_339707 [Basidiobolus meristosporus CBS 931.73]
MTDESDVFGLVLRKSREFFFRCLPIISWLPHYNRKWLFGDTVAGVTVGIMVVPQALAYAQVTGLPVQYGLYSATFCAMVYCLFGTSKDVNIGPITMLSMLTGQVCSQLNTQYGYNVTDVAVMLSFMTGLILLVLSILRLGIILDFISVPVIVGFTSGVGVAIIAIQIPNLVGLAGINTKESALNIVISIFKNISHVSWVDAVLGVSSILALVALEQTKKRFGHRHFAIRFLGIAKNAIIIIVFTLISFVIQTTSPSSNFRIIREVPRGIAPPRFPNIDLVMMGRIAPSALISCLLCLIEHTGELTGLGVCNVVSSIFSGFPVSGSFSRGAVNDQSGVKTPLAGILTGLIAVFALIFLPPLFYFIPNATLAGIIIFSMVSIVSPPGVFHRFWILDRMEFAVAVIGFVVTIFVAIQTGIELAVCCSVVVLLYRVARPRLKFPAILQECGSVKRDSMEVPAGIIVVRLQEALLFPNTEFVRRKVMKNAQRHTRPAIVVNDDIGWNEFKYKGRSDQSSDALERPRPVFLAVILDMSAVNQVDYSGIQGLFDLKFEIGKYAGYENKLQSDSLLHFAAMNPNVAKRMEKCGIFDSREEYQVAACKEEKDAAEIFNMEYKSSRLQVVHKSVFDAISCIIEQCDVHR